MGHVFNVPKQQDFEHVENVLHESFTGSERVRGNVIDTFSAEFYKPPPRSDLKSSLIASRPL